MVQGKNDVGAIIIGCFTLSEVYKRSCAIDSDGSYCDGIIASNARMSSLVAAGVMALCFPLQVFLARRKAIVDKEASNVTDNRISNSSPSTCALSEQPNVLHGREQYSTESQKPVNRARTYVTEGIKQYRLECQCTAHATPRSACHVLNLCSDA